VACSSPSSVSPASRRAAGWGAWRIDSEACAPVSRPSSPAFDHEGAYSCTRVLDVPACRRTRWHRLLGRPRHLGGRSLDARQRGNPLHLHRRHRPIRRARHRQGARARALLYGAELARAVDCRRELVEEGFGPRLRRLPHPLGRTSLLQHHPARPRRHRHHARARHAIRRRRISGATARPSRATTSSGSIATAY
jgi:hypothetical protein